jgi:transcriptional regulator with XRE-family HTH domain
VDALRVGRSLRALRIHRGLRQSDVAASAGISGSQVSRLERGALDRTPIADLVRLAVVLEADLDVRIRWHGEALDRLLDAAHARLVDRVVSLLRSMGWEVAVEVTFNHFGERGSVDVLGWHATTSTILIVEVKSVVPDAQATIGVHDRKTRLARVIGRQRGWDPKAVGSLLVIADSSTSRRRISAFVHLFEAAYPDRIVAVRRWLREPRGSLAGLIFLANSPRGGAGRGGTGRRRVCRPRSR